MKTIIYIITILMSSLSYSQQSVDSIIVPVIDVPYHIKNNGPKVYVDQLHNNFHALDNRFKPFGELLKNDGYKVNALLSYDKLQKTDILVVSNAIHDKNIDHWEQPIHSAFSPNEITKLKTWVNNGGRLLLIADHMPFSGATNALTTAFGFEFCDGFAELSNFKSQPAVFSTENKRLTSTALTNGTYGEKISSVMTFTGSSFSIPLSAMGIFKFIKGDVCLQPEIAWQFNEDTKTIDLENSYQGAIMEFGKGKLAIFGEAAMFTSQEVTNEYGTFSVGFNAKEAPNNIQFIRNLMLWLSTKEKRRL